jgi:hypothetical protein
MKIVITSILLSLLNLSLFGQRNLILNPSFEISSSLPIDIISEGKSYAQDWFVPNFGTPDYYNSKCDTTYKNQIIEILGYFPKSHSGYACMGFISLSLNGGMEHITGTLAEPLEENCEYEVSMYVMLGGKNFRLFEGSIIAYFHNEKNSRNITLFPEFISLNNLQKQKYLALSKISSSDSNWTQISGVYHAAGNERYITIGFFLDKSLKNDLKKYNEDQYNKGTNYNVDKLIKKNKDILSFNSSYAGNKNDFFVSYFLIDDVQVTKYNK